ncbi:MAG: ArsR family transcriptional regulator [Candidatus Saccharibacteria bacterium]|nr:ArsR family transcriptional regulator [Candidatus Saccharibacteria bacterium]
MVFNRLVNYSPIDDPLSQLFAALADPTRRSILARLSVADATVSELAEPYDMSLPAISKHLKILEQVGLVSKSKIAQQRLCRLEAERLQEANEWLGEYRKFWEASLDNLDQYLQDVQSKGKE